MGLLRVAAAVAIGMLAGCLLDLDDAMACGDGHHDPDAGEACDPLDEASFKFVCLSMGSNRVARCTDECELDTNVCFDICGNGRIDQDRGEECDPSYASDDLVQPARCSDLTPPPSDFKNAYVGGIAGIECQDDCEYPRDACHYCGDGVVDRNYENYPEKCDGADFDPDALHEECREACNAFELGLPSDAAVRCDVHCTEDCRTIVPEELRRCCLAPGEAIHPDIPCCTPASVDADTCPSAPI